MAYRQPDGAYPVMKGFSEFIDRQFLEGELDDRIQSGIETTFGQCPSRNVRRTASGETLPGQ